MATPPPPAVELVPPASAARSRARHQFSSQLHLKTRRDGEGGGAGENRYDDLPSKARRSLKVVSQMDHRLGPLLEFRRSSRVVASWPLGAARS